MAASSDAHPQDPFQGHLNFLDGLRGLYPCVRGVLIEPIDLLEVGGSDGINLEALVARTLWQGALKEPVPQAPESYPDGLEEAMSHCEPPLVLRNLGRAERHGDPDEPLPLEPADAPFGLPSEPIGGTGSLDFEPASPTLELSADFFRSRRQERRWLIDDLPWESRFSRELKESISGPLWAWDGKVDPEVHGEEEEVL